jgi:hypothetical protein
MSRIKNYYIERSKQKILKDPSIANNREIDSNKIEDLLMISYSLKTLKLVIIIMNISFFTGVFFLIICEGV